MRSPIFICSYSLVFLLISLDSYSETEPKEPCPPVARSIQNLNNFGAQGMKLGVATMEDATKKEVDKVIANFKVSTLTLAGQNMSKEGIAEWYSNMTNLNRLAFDAINKLGIMKDHGAIKRLAVSLVNHTVAAWVTHRFGTGMHEVAHRDGQLAVGATDTHFGLFGDKDKELTLGQLFLGMFSSNERAFASAKYPVTLSPRQRAGVSAAGINSNTKFAEDLERDAIKNDFVHSSDTIHYMYNKLYLYSYARKSGADSADDPSNYASQIAKQRGYDEKQTEQLLGKIKTYALLSAVMSGRTWDHVISNYKYIKDGETTNPVLGVKTKAGKITLPDFSTYLNSDSVSLKGSTSLIMKEGKVLTLGVERTVLAEKEKVTELSLGLVVPISERLMVDTTVRANDDRSWGTSVDLAYSFDKNWHVVGALDYDRNTLAGDRLHNRFGSAQDGDGIEDRSKGSTQVYFGVGYNFK